MTLVSHVRDLHLEVTSRCTLGCPRCPRTMRPDEFTLGDLPLATLRKTICRTAFPEARYIMLSGNYGDPIYHPQFLEIVEHLKAEDYQLRITTNGSYRPVRWWNELAGRLGRDDHLMLSIDGLEDTNEIYRVNARWADIMGAIEAMRGHVFLVWKMIVFRHNQHQMEAAGERARVLGFDEFKVVRSDRFGFRYTGNHEADPLEPDPDWVSDRVAARAGQAECRINKVTITPRCAKGEAIYLSSEGWLLPCCYTHIHLRRTLQAPERFSPADRWFLDHRELFDANTRSAEEILADPRWDGLKQLWVSTEPTVCRSMCGVWRETGYRDEAELRQRDRAVTRLHGR